MNKIVIKAVDERGETVHYFKMSSPSLAEMAFHAFTHDNIHQDCNWQLIVDGEMINWHYPLTSQK